ncbi:unnamed protein product [Nippostrongylus brasiliensis]|uniref:HAUS6_N domain-containing protein n=1 Tax=Nippostrongylus brasiliensis TaxID=27835 RepID=A0A158R2B9_NIPBR|nr:unnamed protein product [Nippostrongylus brasiliensis]
MTTSTNHGQLSRQRDRALAGAGLHVPLLRCVQAMPGVLSPPALRFALLATDEPSKAAIVRLARLLAAFYLDFPLFVPPTGTAYPSLFIWTELKEAELPTEYGPRTPAVLFAHCGLVLEAIFYCDHFSDLRSSVLLRLFADTEYGLSLSDTFFEELWTVELSKQLNSLVEEQATPERTAAFCSRYVQSALELDVFKDGRDLTTLQTFALSQMDTLFAQLQLKVHDTTTLPRPPIYCVQNAGVNSSELKIFAKIHLYLQVLLISLQKANRMVTEINRLHAVLSEEETTNRPNSILIRALVLVLRTIYRDAFSLALDEKRNDLPPLTRLSRQVWREAMFREDKETSEKTDWLSSVFTPTFKVPAVQFELMTFIATDWTTPMARDTSLIPLLLKLQPTDVCSPCPSVPTRPSLSARPTAGKDHLMSPDRIFSPRVDIIAEYAERGRRLLAKDEQKSTITRNDGRIRALQQKLKSNVMAQRALEDVISEERSFLESLPSFSPLPGKIESRGTVTLSERISRDKGPYETLKEATKAVNRELQLLSGKLSSMRNLVGDSEESSSVADSQRTEIYNEEAPGSSEEGVSDEEPLEDLPLDYNDTVPVENPLPEIAKLDLSLLSPSVDVHRRAVNTKPPKGSSSPKKGLVLPEWMRLLPLGETSSTRLPLLRYSPPVQRDWKTERSTQTQGFQFKEKTDTGCQTAGDERNPSDSGFLDVTDKSPRKKIEIVQSMSKQNIQQMLSQM